MMSDETTVPKRGKYHIVLHMRQGMKLILENVYFEDGTDMRQDFMQYARMVREGGMYAVRVEKADGAILVQGRDIVQVQYLLATPTDTHPNWNDLYPEDEWILVREIDW